MKIRAYLSAPVVVALSLLLGNFNPLNAEDADAAYTRVIAQRADRILDPMEITDAAVRERVQGIVMQFYRDLSALQDAHETAAKALKESGVAEDAVDTARRVLDLEFEKERHAVNLSFTGQLYASLSAEQVVAVKDGITYGVVPLTFGVYQEMLPDLDADKRHFILAQLCEAREYALTSGSSHGRHQAFGRAKGRINNMLSQAGIDMKQAEADMRARKAAN